ncbi:30S ribosomal protein S9 [Candidatus Dojkabacteria bacterium]|nr:30S ribosomal protein S9 [Candidatus Dojkabacteria bacterium]
MVDKKLKYIEGIGRRKTSTARARIYDGEDISIVNGKDIKEYFFNQSDLESAIEPLTVTNTQKKFGYSISVNGGGISGQSGAASLALARALVKFDETLKPALKAKGLMTRDPRMVERKKYFLKKARKSPQYSKR